MKKNTMIRALLITALGTAPLLGCGSSSDPVVQPTPLGGQAVGSTTNTLGASLDEYVTLTFQPTAGGAPVVVMTALDGTYAASLSAGDYDLVATRPGYEDYDTGVLTVSDGAVTTHDFSMVALPDNTYIGSADCGVCHASHFDTFRRSGHPYKLNKVENGQMPTYPFSSIAGALAMIDDDDTDVNDTMPGTDNTLSTPQSYFDVPYVIGGFNWKARFTDADGYVVTGSAVQYNLFDQTMVGYHDNETDKPFNCGNCHTTGWKHVDPLLNPTGQDGLVGMHGTFAEPGIQCESCHGSGARHAQTKNITFITEEAQPRTTADMLMPDMGYGLPTACGECHTRDGERDYPTYVSSFDNARIAANEPLEPMGGRILAKGGFIRHHEQYDEILGIDPDDPLLASTRSANFMGAHGQCIACHDTHTTTVYQDISGDSSGIKVNCMNCHADKALTGGMKDLNCIDCHMPLLAKSAGKTFDPLPGDDRPPLGDVRSHIFTIDTWLDPATDQFTADGKYARPVLTGEYACQSCHSWSGPSFPISQPWLGKIHN